MGFRREGSRRNSGKSGVGQRKEGTEKRLSKNLAKLKKRNGNVKRRQV